MNILALDTCLNSCSVIVWEGDRALVSIEEPMARGHQERLAPMAAEAMAQAGVAFSRLDRVAVTVGPGSFTGLRVGLAFAKGLALALEIPCVGVGALEALAGGRAGFAAACVDARRDQLYFQAFADGRAVMAPDVLAVETAAARLAELWSGGPAWLAGSGAALLQGVLPDAVLDMSAIPDLRVVARAAAAAQAPFPPPRPLYLRAPDARLPQG